MPRSRDRHGRGIRGPIAPPQLLRSRPLAHAEAFAGCVERAVRLVESRCPEALIGVQIGIDDVPVVTRHTEAVPLALAVEAQPGRPARVVLYRRPLELRASSRAGLRALVHRVLVEQLATVTVHTAWELAGDDLDDAD